MQWLTYGIEIDDAYEDIYKDKDKFRCCKYPENAKFYNKQKVTITMKDETRSVRNVELVGLKSKMYCINSLKKIKRSQIGKSN